VQAENLLTFKPIKIIFTDHIKSIQGIIVIFHLINLIFDINVCYTSILEAGYFSRYSDELDGSLSIPGRGKRFFSTQHPDRL
jgi:hypothetical protein